MTVNATDVQSETTLDEGHYSVLHLVVDAFSGDGGTAEARRIWAKMRAQEASLPVRDINSHVAAAQLKGPHTYNSSAC